MKVLPPLFTEFLVSVKGSKGVFTTNGLVIGCPEIKLFAPPRRRLRASKTVSLSITASIQ